MPVRANITLISWVNSKLFGVYVTSVTVGLTSVMVVAKAPMSISVVITDTNNMNMPAMNRPIGACLTIPRPTNTIVIPIKTENISNGNSIFANQLNPAKGDIVLYKNIPIAI